jgi:hypothetical protein
MQGRSPGGVSKEDGLLDCRDLVAPSISLFLEGRFVT